LPPTAARFHPVAPGDEYVYAFTVPTGERRNLLVPPPSPSPDGLAGRHGALRRDRHPLADDPLPESLPEKLLILADNRFLRTARSISRSATRSRGGSTRGTGGKGDVLFVNGQILPQVPIRSGEVQRWRVINASGARIYRLALPGHTFLHVGSDGGLFERPVEVDEILLANGERASCSCGGPEHRAAERAPDAAVRPLHDADPPR
jgi:FtsP/CotA-like multicopper oxidase with cupredoxin domain